MIGHNADAWTYFFEYGNTKLIRIRDMLGLQFKITLLGKEGYAKKWTYFFEYENTKLIRIRGFGHDADAWTYFFQYENTKLIRTRGFRHMRMLGLQFKITLLGKDVANGKSK